MLDLIQMAILKRKLLDRRDVLRGEIRVGLQASRDESHGELAGAVHDAGDDSVADLLVDVNLKGMERDAHERSAIGAALERMARKEYGVCSDCRGEIGYERLEALPAAARCIECEKRHRQRYEHERSSTL